MSPIDPNKIMIPDPSPKQRWKNRRMIRKWLRVALGALTAIFAIVVFTDHEEFAMPFGIAIVALWALQLLMDVGDAVNRDP